MTNHSRTIAAGSYIDILPGSRVLAGLIIENSGGNDCYWGYIPPPPVTVDGEFNPVVHPSGSPLMSFPQNVPVVPGMVYEDPYGVFSDATVIAVDGGNVRIASNATDELNGVTSFLFTAPDVDATTGMTLMPGARENFTTAVGGRFLQRGLRIYSTGGTTVKICMFDK